MYRHEVTYTSAVYIVLNRGYRTAFLPFFDVAIESSYGRRGIIEPLCLTKEPV